MTLVSSIRIEFNKKEKDMRKNSVCQSPFIVHLFIGGFILIRNIVVCEELLWVDISLVKNAKEEGAWPL